VAFGHSLSKPTMSSRISNLLATAASEREIVMKQRDTRKYDQQLGLIVLAAFLAVLLIQGAMLFLSIWLGA
jgi:hypothetical protein